MLAALIPLAWLAWWLALVGRYQTLRLTEGGALSLGLVGAVAYLAPPALSVYGLFDGQTIGLLWLLFSLSCLPLGIYPRGRSVVTGVRRVVAAVSRTARVARSASPASLAWATALGVLLALPLAGALLYPPTVWDSLAYHVPAALQYVQNQTVATFPTYYAPMIDTYPGALYLLGQVYAMGGQGALNLIQWFALVVVAGGVYATSRELGASQKGAQLATILAVASPTVILQASTSQHDLLVAAWVVVAAYLAVRLTNGTSAPVLVAVGLGATLGVGFVTKPTFLVVAAPVALWALWRTVRGGSGDGDDDVASRRPPVRRLAVVTLTVALAIGSPLLSQNLARSGSILGTGAVGNSGLMVSDTSAGALWANLTRNLSTAFATPSAGVNHLIESAAASVGGLFGSSVYGATNVAGKDVTFGLTTLATSPESTPAPLLAILGLAALIYLLVHRVLGRRRAGGVVGDGRDSDRGGNSRQADANAAIGFGAAAVVGWLALAGLLAYQPWAVRFYMGPLLLLAPVVGVAVAPASSAMSNLDTPPAGWRHGAIRFATVTLVAAGVIFGVAVALLHITQPLIPVSLVTRGNLGSPGWWSAPYDERAVVMSVPFMGPEVRFIEGIAASERDEQGLSTRIAYLGGTATDALPASPLMEAFIRKGYAVELQATYGPPRLTGRYEALSDRAPTVVVSYDTPDDDGSQILTSGPLAARIGGQAYHQVWARTVPELGARVTIWLLGR